MTDAQTSRARQYHVVVAAELVDQLMAEPSQPVTVRITERKEDGELRMVMTRHDCHRETE